MKICAIDIETTGINPETCQILQVGAVLEDTCNVINIEDLPRFSCIVEHEIYKGEAFALSLNRDTLEILSLLDSLPSEQRADFRKKKYILKDSLVPNSMWMWLVANGLVAKNQIEIIAAGKNFATFDQLFLEKLPTWSNFIKVHRRIIDPTVLLTDWKNDEIPPSLNECLRRCNLKAEVKHDAVSDALDVIKVLRVATNNYTTNFFNLT